MRDPRDFRLYIISSCLPWSKSDLFKCFFCVCGFGFFHQKTLVFVGLHASPLQLVMSASNLICDIGVKTVELDQGSGLFIYIYIFDLNTIVNGSKASAIFSHFLNCSGIIRFYFWVVYLWHFKWPTSLKASAPCFCTFNLTLNRKIQ